MTVAGRLPKIGGSASKAAVARLRNRYCNVADSGNARAAERHLNAARGGVTQGPDGGFGPILTLNVEFAENLVAILFNGSFREVLYEGNLFVQLGMSYEFHNLLLGSRETPSHRLRLLRFATTLTDTLLSINPEFVSTAVAIPDVFT